MTLPRESRESAKTGGRPPPRALLLISSANASATQVTVGRIRPFFSLRGWSHDRLARTACGSRSEPPAIPALLPSGYLLAALALLMLAHPAILGWIVGAWVVRGGWVFRGRLAAAAGVTGAPALLVIGTTLAAGRSSRGLEVDRSRPPPPARSGKISPSYDHLVKGCAMPPLEPIWVVFVMVVLVGCVLLAVRAFRRRRR